MIEVATMYVSLTERWANEIWRVWQRELDFKYVINRSKARETEHDLLKAMGYQQISSVHHGEPAFLVPK